MFGEGCIPISTGPIHLLLLNARLYSPLTKGLTFESPMSCAFWPCQHNNQKHICFIIFPVRYAHSHPSTSLLWSGLSKKFLEKKVWFTFLLAQMWFVVGIESGAQTCWTMIMQLCTIINDKPPLGEEHLLMNQEWVKMYPQISLSPSILGGQSVSLFPSLSS